MEVKDKVALVTGGANGIGFEIARELLKSKAKGVILVDINATAGETALKTLQDEFDAEKVYFIKTDITNNREFENVFKKAIELFGYLDIVVNNAGIANEENYNLTININLIGVVRGITLGLKYMSKDNQGKGGMILNISSIAAFDLQQICPIYSSTKAALVNLARGFGDSLHYNRTGVHVMSLCPGYTETGLLERSNLRADCREMLMPFLATQNSQSPSAVGRAAVYVLEHGSSGTVWVINESNLHKMNFPTWQTISEPVVQNI